MYFKNHFNFLILIFILISSILIANLYFNKFESSFFERNGYKHSSLYQEDTISYYFPQSNKLIEDKNKNIKFFESGSEYTNSFLYPRLIFIFNNLVNKNKKIFDEEEKIIILKNDKLFIYLQIIIFYISLIILYFSFSKILEKKLSKIICLILFINPIIFQWHLSFYTESLYLSFLILLTSFLIKAKNLIDYFLIGTFVGIMYMQRTITFLYPLVIFIYIMLLDENLVKKIFKFLCIIGGLTLILVIIGHHNYKRVGIFYYTPTQTKLDLQRYVEVDVIKKLKKISIDDARKELDNFNTNILKNLKLDLSKENDRIIFSNLVQKNSLKNIINNKIITFKIISKNYFHSAILNPVQVYFEVKFENWYEYSNSPEHKFWLIIRLIITPIFFIFSGFGFFFSIKKVDMKLNLFIFLSICYFFIFGCWLPNTRYFVPSQLFMSIYFSICLLQIIKYFEKNLFKRS